MSIVNEDILIDVNVSSLEQISNKRMLVGMLGVKEIISAIQYTVREPLELDPFDSNSNDNDKVPDHQYYQRVKDSDRAYSIKMFFLKHIYYKWTYSKKLISPLGLFPSSIILGCESYPDPIQLDDYKLLSQSEDTDYVFIDENENKLYLPGNNKALIVDGQHRIAGLERLLEEIENGAIDIKRADKNERYIADLPPLDYIREQIESFKFLVTFLIDFDRYEQAELFATVNFTQKPVNKSYLYDIFGSIRTGKSLEKLLHDLTAYLNYNSNSPLYKKIKMLGRGEGYFSQAFLVDSLIPLFKKGIFEGVLTDYLNNGSKYKRLPKFFEEYFKAFSNAFSDYLPEENQGKYKHVLYKTNGMGAIIALMPYLNKKLKDMYNERNVLDIPSEKVYEGLITILDSIKANGVTYFGENGDFSKGSSKGFQSKLFNLMLEDLNIQKEKNIFL